jgi:glutamine cyclotransferase
MQTTIASRLPLAVRSVACIGMAALLGCHADADDASRPPASYVLPAFLPPAETHADTTPPPIPYDRATPVLAARVLTRMPHDTLAYTQGLVVHGDRLLEGTGIEGRSELRELDRASGRVERRTALAATLFGEGIAVVDQRIYQLTWKGGRGFVYHLASLAPVDSFTYEGEGWGLASDGRLLYMSDGSSDIRIVDPTGFRTLRTLHVTEAGHPVWMLNELEWVDGVLWANIYETGWIARIDAATGHVTGWMNVGALLTAGESAGVERRGGVANGIAYDSVRHTLLVTGKLWPRLFELALPRPPR